MCADSVALMYEFLGPQKAKWRFERLSLRQSFLGKYGIISDDSEHLILCALALIKSDNTKQFEKEMRAGVGKWLLTLPVAVGMSTLKAGVKILFGCRVSGVVSAGNGPGMRSAIIAAMYWNNKALRDEYLKISSSITHIGPEASGACIAQANLMSYLIEHNEWPRENLAQVLAQGVECKKIKEVIEIIQWGVERSESEFLQKLLDKKEGQSLCVSGYMPHSMGYALYCAIKYKDINECMRRIILNAGDTDSIGAVCAGVLACVSESKKLSDNEAVQDRVDFYASWDDLILFPIKKDLITKLSQALEDKYLGRKKRCYSKEELKFPFLLYFFRNLFVTTFILSHALLRLRPKWFYKYFF